MPERGDWHDPFAEDEAALERERRRAEREARRRGEQVSIGEKVAAEQSASGAPPVSAEQPPTGEGPATPPREPTPPPAAPPTAEHPRAETGEHAAPATGEHPHYETGEHAAPAHLPRRVRETSNRELLLRRALGIGLIIAFVAIAGFGLKAVLDRVSGGDDPFVEPTKALKVTEVTIPEGLDRHQIAEVAKDNGLKGDYVEATKKAPKGFDMNKYGAENAESLEGFLFPALYELEKNANVKDLVNKQLDAFRANLAEVNLDYAKSKNLTVFDVVIIASMIEREIQVAEERKLAAAVIYNRLSAGDTLGIDATIRFEDQNYDEQLLESRLSEPTPYNTRVNPGLPPGPIGNPGLASLEAAANPAKSDAYYFVVKPGTCGEHTFVETEAEFAEAEAAYQAALQEEGGSPTDCAG